MALVEGTAGGSGAEAGGGRAMRRIRFVNQEPCDLTKVSGPALVMDTAALDAGPRTRTASARPLALAAPPPFLTVSGAPLCGAQFGDW